MTRFRFFAGAALCALSAAALAQTAPPPSPSMPALGDADRLAADMRLVASDPRDVAALVEAGELSLRLGDVSGAASLFARADRVDPRNGRVKAGMAGVLLRNERPGEALVYFGQAEGYGLPVASFAGDRGLAYDLIGQQGRAQRDYRAALLVHADDETVRRYALSLAISGQKDAALLQLDPLVRRGDRAAWRTRAFVMAMGGDAAGATDIARRMMAPGQAEGLAPFFQRLPTLNAVDRAFAVQFGEVRPTAQRIADARMAPALPPMAPELVALPVVRSAPVKVAAVPAPAPKRRGRRDVQVAAAVPIVVAPMPAAAALPAPPAYTAPVQMAYAAPAAATARGAASYHLARAGTGTDPVSAANAAMLAASRGPSPQPARPAAALPSLAAAPRPAIALTPPVALVATTTSPAPSSPRAIVPAGAQVSGFSEQFRAARARDAAAAAANRSALATTPAPAVPGPRVLASAQSAPPQVASAAPASIEPAATAPVRSAVVAPVSALPAPSSGENDAVLARLLSRITLPGEELARAAQVAAAPVDQAAVREAPVPASAPARAAEAPIQIAAAPIAQPAPVETHRMAPTPPTAAATRAAAASPKPGTRGKQVEADSSAESGEPSSPRASRSRHGQASANASTETEQAAEAPVSHGRHGRTEIADATAKPGARRGQASRDTADESSANSSRTGRGDADPSAKPGRHGKQLADADDPPLTPAQKRAADRKAAADKKSDEAKKPAGAQKLADAKQAAEGKKAAKAEPQRYWVQVSGGANEADLPKAWAKAQGEAPALKGRSGYTAPLRATNRVLAGPFKTNAEAKSFMDKVRAQGIPAWQFTSEPGQKVTKLP